MTSLLAFETWKRTAQGWKLVFVDEVREHVRRAEDEP